VQNVILVGNHNQNLIRTLSEPTVPNLPLQSVLNVPNLPLQSDLNVPNLPLQSDLNVPNLPL